MRIHGTLIKEYDLYEFSICFFNTHRLTKKDKKFKYAKEKTKHYIAREFSYFITNIVKLVESNRDLMVVYKIPKGDTFFTEEKLVEDITKIRNFFHEKHQEARDLALWDSLDE